MWKKVWKMWKIWKNRNRCTRYSKRYIFHKLSAARWRDFAFTCERQVSSNNVHVFSMTIFRGVAKYCIQLPMIRSHWTQSFRKIKSIPLIYIYKTPLKVSTEFTVHTVHVWRQWYHHSTGNSTYICGKLVHFPRFSLYRSQIDNFCFHDVFLPAKGRFLFSYFSSHSARNSKLRLLSPYRSHEQQSYEAKKAFRAMKKNVRLGMLDQPQFPEARFIYVWIDKSPKYYLTWFHSFLVDLFGPKLTEKITKSTQKLTARCRRKKKTSEASVFPCFIISFSKEKSSKQSNIQCKILSQILKKIVGDVCETTSC